MLFAAGGFEAITPLLLAQQTGSPEVIVTDQLPPLPPALRQPPTSFPGRPLVPIPNQLTDPRSPQGSEPSGRGATPILPPASTPFQQFARTSFSMQLERSFSMIGDFFGRPASSVTVGEFCGTAIQHTIASGSAFADDDLHILMIDDASGKTVFVGGPAGLVPGSFLEPSSAPPLPSVVTDLTLNGTTTSEITAVKTSGTIDVFDDPADLNPSISSAEVYNIYKTTTLLVPGPNIGDIVGRVRIQDNNSALPRDRFIFDYNFFYNVPLASNGVNVNRFVPGIEKTFMDGMGSVEIRVPMAITLTSDFVTDRPADRSEYEFGNVVIAPKILLTSNRESALAAGIGIAVPTADDIVVYGAGGDRLLKISNESVHLIPYLAYAYAPQRSQFFSQAFLTLDVDTNGNPVEANMLGTGLERIGVWNDQTLLSASGSVGQYLYQNNSRRSTLKALAWSAELHYITTVNDADTVTAQPFLLGDSSADLSLLNGTVGAHARFRTSTATIGYSFPLTSSDRVFDGEFRFFMNRFY